MEHTGITPQRVAWSFDQIAEATGLSTAFLRKEARRGALQTQRFGRRVLVLDSALRAYMDKGSEGSKSEQQSSEAA